MAVIEWVPTESDGTLKLAVPSLSAAVPRMVVPSSKVTVPVGVPLPGDRALTVAVNLTDCPYTDGLADEARAVVVPAGLTPWLIAVAVLVVKLPSPP
jgi:hypothetical protein